MVVYRYRGRESDGRRDFVIERKARECKSIRRYRSALSLFFFFVAKRTCERMGRVLIAVNFALNLKWLKMLGTRSPESIQSAHS